MLIPAGFRALPLDIAQLSLAAVLKCGQSFRWIALPLTDGLGTTISDVEYRFTLRDRVICLRQSSDTLFYRAVFPDDALGFEKTRDAETLAWLRDYFQLDVDLVDLYDRWGKLDPVFGRFRSRFSGIRMLRQDPWENLVSFICSQNNHISRITNMVQSLCTHFSPPLLSLPSSSPPLPTEYCTYHPFPSPALLATPGTSTVLRSLGFGYRAEYIERTAKMLVDLGSESFVNNLRDKPTDEAREELLKFVGVGRKVADCILLMSLNKHEVVPVDTHVHQIAMKYYGMKGSGSKTAMTPKLYNDIQAKLMAVWGDYAGWAHTVLFTADLKSFAEYGLPTPSPSVSPEKRPKMNKAKVTPESPVPVKSRKRVLKVEAEAQGKVISSLELHEEDLADRIKRRRRTTSVVHSYVEVINK